MYKPEWFSPDYMTARQRFREAERRCGWTCESHSIGLAGPHGEDLTIDVGYSSADGSERTLVVSSGVHGVEGFFGSAVQLATLEQWAGRKLPIRCVLLHGLNPFGFAWLRRFDENNVDPNRNFLLAGECYEGSPPHYSDLDKLLNPQRPPSALESFLLKACPAIARHGMPTLRQAIAAGQYEFPQGLFFGGAGPSAMHKLLKHHMPRWLKGSQSVMHLDFHTGLGPKGSCKLLIDYPMSPSASTRLTGWFGADSFEASSTEGISHKPREGFGHWCVSQQWAPEYLFAFGEFGTYGPIRVITGLRAENQAHHWGSPAAAMTVRVKQRLKEIFCPCDVKWQKNVLDHSLALVSSAIEGLQQ